MENLISKNIKYLKELNGLSQQKFADLIDKKRSVAGSYERGDAEPSIETLKKICRLFNVSLDDIVNIDFSEINPNIIGKNADETADKTAYLPKNISKSLNTDINFSGDKAIQVLENEGLTGRRVYISPEPATAGYLSSYINKGQNSLEWFYMPFLQANGLYACFRVQGRSMEEYVLEGSWVVCRLLEESWQVRSGNLHLVATKSEGVLLKRIRQEPKIIKKGLVCYSDNSQYLPFVVPNEQIQAIWAVEMFLQKEFPFTNEKASEALEQYLKTL